MSTIKETGFVITEPTGIYDFELFSYALMQDNPNKLHEPPVFSPDFKINGHNWQIRFSAWPMCIPFQLIKKTKSHIKANYKLRVLSQHKGKQQDNRFPLKLNQTFSFFTFIGYADLIFEASGQYGGTLLDTNN